MTCLEVISPGKINLFLRITGKRSDGYHELVSLMSPIGLADKLRIELDGRGRDTGKNSDSAIRVSCSDPDVPCDDTNLAFRAAVLFAHEYQKKTEKVPFRSLDIYIEKQIPMGAGLGGGSSNAASVLLALNGHFSCPFPLESLSGMGMRLGADVPFFVYGQPALIQGVGEKVTVVPLPCRDWHVLICYPGVSASTGMVFKKYDFYLTEDKKYYTITDPILLMETLNIPAGIGLCNDLKDAAFSLYPEIEQAAIALVQILDKKIFMSGSGSCLFALYPSFEEARRGYEMGNRKYPDERAKFFLAPFYKK